MMSSELMIGKQWLVELTGFVSVVRVATRWEMFGLFLDALANFLELVYHNIAPTFSGNYHLVELRQTNEDATAVPKNLS